ncbi:undecaprenyl-diphosphatase [Mesorhizobium sp. SP-1A]|uniref:undecaprenyl-diphosphatase n=1 Tax=Mesorhizobium sp. SP-1A TaxID=3077840 RepID=UPI0028F70E2E|nr:undecaprenyl-diphosphatase [Mesorhizobium sp. SP-1A]
MFQFDTKLFLLLNAGVNPNAGVEWLAIFAAKFVILAIPLYLAKLWIAGGQRNRLTALALVLALILAGAVGYVIGAVAFRPRPFMIGLGHLLISHSPDASFPSDHGLAFAVWAAVLFMTRRWAAAWLATALGVLVAWSRIYLGVHYPLDMVGAAIIAVPVAMLSLWIVDRYGGAMLMPLEQLQRQLLRRFAKT